MKTGVQEIRNELKTLDSGFRRNDGKRRFSTFYETIEDERLQFFVFAETNGSAIIGSWLERTLPRRCCSCL
ncbi:MAG: hypothetical protein A2170_04885 [Deltaproteobacteria bacterium RBG_13_53_10]|nr:MAG: hypothetical protein A2170_04885 [Deltaproteobacteria bacterium RBG_13_53_10]